MSGRSRAHFEGGASRICPQSGLWCERKGGAETDPEVFGLFEGRKVQLRWKAAGGACFRGKIRSSVLGTWGCRCLRECPVLSLDPGRLSGLEHSIWKWHQIRFL